MFKKINLVVTGATGRMGQSILDIVSSMENFQVHAKVSLKSDKPGIVSHISKVPLVDNMVVIDFTLPEAFDDILEWCEENKTPFVCGTTGLSGFQFEKLSQASQKIPSLWASNMSVGVAFLRRLLKNYGQLDGFDFQIEEFHHNKKVDSPSGTAKTLQEDLEKYSEKALPDVLAIRGGGIYGIHKIYAMSDEEVITLSHEALNRGVFAKGALRAAQWLVQQPAGKYDILDTLDKGL